VLRVPEENTLVSDVTVCAWTPVEVQVIRVPAGIVRLGGWNASSTIVMVVALGVVTVTVAEAGALVPPGPEQVRV
jgi:hypothetical protein